MRIRPNYGHQENEYTFFCTQCSSKTVLNGETENVSEYVNPREVRSTDVAEGTVVLESSSPEDKTSRKISLIVSFTIVILVVTFAGGVYISAGTSKQENDEIQKQREAVSMETTTSASYVGTTRIIEQIDEILTQADNSINSVESIPDQKSDYILPGSSIRYLTSKDLEGFTVKMCRLARNELFARHRRGFKDEMLQEYFNTCSWYEGTIEPDEFDDGVFNSYEVANRDSIIQYEMDRGCRQSRPMGGQEMSISQVLQFEGPIGSLVWKNLIEDFNTTSQLIVDKIHEALLVVNRNACSLFGPGRRTLETPNISLVKRITNLPTNDQTAFPCKVSFINKVHQMDITWRIPGEITLDDPVYGIFLYVGMCGNMNSQVMDSRKFILKIVGFRGSFNAGRMVAEFRGIIKQYVKSYISEIMNIGKVSYFGMNENLSEISEVVKEQLGPLFVDYRIDVLQFSIETITIPDENFETVRGAKEVRASRVIQGHTWQEERQMDITQAFAGNEGTMGNIGDVVGGFTIGGASGGSVADLVRDVLSPGRIPTENSPKDLNSVASPVDSRSSKPFDVTGFMNHFEEQEEEVVSGNSVPDDKMGPKAGGGEYYTNCGSALSDDMVFYPKCGTRQAKEYPKCHTQLLPDTAFRHRCGTPC